MNEAQALRLCIEHRDPAGFEFLVRKYEREAYLHATALLGNRHDAADACQESFAKAFASLSRLSEINAFYPWFYRILRNHCLNALSRRKTASDYSDAIRHDGEPSRVSAETDAISSEEAARVWSTLGSLKPEFREILALKFIRGYDYRMLAELIGIPRGTVMSRLYHARKAFQQAYESADASLESTRP
ncbi:MAG: RNA polymerase sigma factor, partial [Gammaproteobacteria bacterium]|nr:RNA polymerase sigma factor [Gammaproteobacteria bacterium]